MDEKNIDGWPSWYDLRRGIIGFFLIIAPTIFLNTYLPSWIQSYKITGEALWKLKEKGVPTQIIKPMLVMRGEPYFFKKSLLNDVQKITPDIFYKYRNRIERSLIPFHVKDSEFIVFVILN